MRRNGAHKRWVGLLGGLVALVVATPALLPVNVQADGSASEPGVQALDGHAGVRLAPVNGIVRNLRVQECLEGTSEDLYPSRAECVAAVEASLAACCQRRFMGLWVRGEPGLVRLYVRGEREPHVRRWCA